MREGRERGRERERGGGGGYVHFKSFYPCSCFSETTPIRPPPLATDHLHVVMYTDRFVAAVFTHHPVSADTNKVKTSTMTTAMITTTNKPTKDQNTD